MPERQESHAATRDECPDCGCDRTQGKTRNCSGCVEDWPARSAASVDETAMDRWVAQFRTRDDAAEAYAELLRTRPADWGVWPILNAALMDRWSMSALVYIKEKAWKIAAA